MRLINTTTLTIEEFKSKHPPYAILSHTWGAEEVTFEEYTQPRARSKAGFTKIRGVCAQAKKDDCEYLWIDTNCIKKSDPLELNEAIASMFRWYREAGVCYAYLADVPDSAVAVDKRGQLTVSSTFVNSRWFTRGWTLQELLAPKNVVFFSQNWRPLGSKNTLQHPLAQITGVPADYLVGSKPLRAASVAERMSWMSKRVTQRAEDMAYSMLGIFDIYMPLIYGDGPAAFVRLQKAIIQKTDDHSIFCWEWDHTVDPSWSSVLAPCPRLFAHSAKYYPKLWDYGDEVTSHEISGGALSIELPVVQTADPSVALAVLEVCIHGQDSKALRVGLLLRTGRFFQRLPCPPHPVPVDGSMLGGRTRIHINTAKKPLDHRFKSSDLLRQQIQTRLFHADLGRAARARVGFFLAFHLGGCEVELLSAQPGVELLRTISMVAFIDPVVSGGSSSFMATALKIKHKTIGETVVLLAARRQGSGFLFYTQALMPNARHTKTSIDGALARLREQSARENGDKSYQSGREVRVTMGGSFPFLGTEDRWSRLFRCGSTKPLGISAWCKGSGRAFSAS